MKGRQAFTLVELLVVIAIIAVLAAALFPVFSQAREKARQGSCLSNQHQLALLAIQCAEDHGGGFPPADVIWQKLEAPQRILICPTAGKAVRNAYVINNVIPGGSIEAFDDPSDATIIFDGAHRAADFPDTYDNIAYSWRDVNKRHTGRFIASYLDGHVAMTGDMPAFIRFSTAMKSSSATIPGLEIWFASDWGVSQEPDPDVIRWMDRGRFKLKAHPANKNHRPTYFPSVPSLGGAPAMFFKPPNNNPNMLVTEDIGYAWDTSSREATMFIVFQPTGNNPNFEYSVFDQHNGDPEQATRVRQGSQGHYPDTAGSPSALAGPPKVSLTASPTSVEKGGTVTLTWTSDATAVVSSNFGIGPGSPASGSTQVTVNATTTFTITVTNGKEKSASVKVTVTDSPDPTVTLTASPLEIERGSTATLSWSSKDASTVVSSNFGAKKVSGSTKVSPSETTTYAITVSGPGGQASAQVTVTVVEDLPDVDPFCGRISWFRKSAAVKYPPTDVPWNTPTLWTIASSETEYRAYNKGVPWPDYRGGSDWLAPDYFTIGGSTKGKNANQRSFDGYIGEVIIFRRVLNDRERKAVEKYLMTKFDLK